MKRQIHLFLKTLLIAALGACALFCGAPAARRASAAQPLSLNGIFGDDMILQRDKRVKVWGYGGARGASVCVSFAGQEQTAVIGEEGWEVYLDPMPASAEGKTLTVSSGGETISVRDVCVGEVLLCSGQSNIAITVQYVFNKSDAAIDDYRTYDNFGLIRLYTPVWGGKPEETIYTAPYSVWRRPKRIQDVLNCSAYAAALALNVQAKLGNGIPVGVIETSTGGSCIEEWLSADNMKDLPSHNGSHSSYYNGMVAFLKGLALNGVFWYQGEACVEFTGQYERQLAALIGQYRSDFGDETLPVYIMQLPQVNAAVAYGSEGFASSWAKMRDVQEKASQGHENVYTSHYANDYISRYENVYTVCLIDTGDGSDDSDCIHPADKWQVGERAAGAFVATALKLPYEELAAKGSYGLSPKICSAVWKDGVLTLELDGGERFSCKDEAAGGFEAIYADGSKEKLTFRLQGNKLTAAAKKAAKIRYLATDKVSCAFVVNEYGLPVMPVYEMAVEDRGSSQTEEESSSQVTSAQESSSEDPKKNPGKGCKSGMTMLAVLPALGAGVALWKRKDEKRK